jgi:MFS family permease
MITAEISGQTSFLKRQRQVRRARQVRLAAAFLLMFISGLVWNTFGLFLISLEGEFHWSRSAISGAYGAFALTNALTAPAFGYAMTRWDSRPLLAGASLLLGFAFCGLAFVETIGQFWLVFGILAGLGTHCTSSYAIFSVLAGRFRKRPATAMAIADAGSGLAAFIGLPLIHWVIGDYGWRSAYLVLGVLIASLGVVLHLLALDRVRRASSRQASRNGLSLVHFALAALALSYFCGSAAYHGLLTQQIALFDEHNVPEDTAVWLAAVAGLVIFIWRLLSGWLCDRWGPSKIMVVASGATGLTFITLLVIFVAETSPALFIYPLVLGIAFGGQQVLLASGAGKMFPLAALAGILGVCRLAAGLGMAAGPVMTGYFHDMTGGYALAIIILGLVSLGHFISFLVAVKSGRPDPSIVKAVGSI